MLGLKNEKFQNQKGVKKGKKRKKKSIFLIVGHPTLLVLFL